MKVRGAERQQPKVGEECVPDRFSESQEANMVILHVVGARPNFMKVASVRAALVHRDGVRQVLVHTGQHYEVSMSEVFSRQLGIPEPDFNLGIPCLTVRNNAERPVTVSLGTNILVGRDMERLKVEARNILSGKPKAGTLPALWDGKAGEKIADVIVGKG